MEGFRSAPGGSLPAGYLFAGFRLEPDGRLLRGSTLVDLSPQEIAALRLLLERAGLIVTPLELKQTVWGDMHVTTDAVTECVSSLRMRLDPSNCIQTVYKRGYRFTAEVRTSAQNSASTLPRLAILPFTTDSSAHEYLGSAVVEETSARLSAARPPIASPLATDSVFFLAGRGLTPRQIGETLNADFVLSGTLRILPSHYRLHVELFGVEAQSQLWTEDLLVERSRIAGLESELVDLLAFRLNGPGISISASADAAPAPEHEQLPQHRDAYEIFERARFEWRTLERHRMQDGLQHLLRATELDPSLVAARVDLVHLCVAQCFYGFMSPAVAADMARRTASSIPDISVQAETILPALGWISFHFDRNLPAALSSFSESAHLPHDPLTTLARSMFALSRHRFGEAIDTLRAAIRVDPWSPLLHSRLAWALHLAGQDAASVDQTRFILDRFPDHDGTCLYGAMILAANGQAPRAVELAHGLARRLPFFDLAATVHAYALACALRPDEARIIIERLSWLSRERYVLNTFSPAVYMALGEPELAIGELQTAERMRCPWFFQMLADPRLNPLRQRPEFQSMLNILTALEATAERDWLEE